tara:strand:+ start:927 stop:1610 length:684 start_codon:yes stop_codon:yes gene_type:complete
MNWDDTGFLLSKNKYNENSIIAEIFTEYKGKCTGIIFGGTSKKIKNYLEIGNKFYVNYNFKNENKMGYFKVEILKAHTPMYFDDKNKLLCISSALNLIKLLTVEAQENSKIFKLIDNFFLILESKNWLKEYILWELNFFKLIGYDLEIENIVNHEIKDSKNEYYVKSKNQKKFVPSFLVEKNSSDFNKDELLKGLKLVSDYMEKSILKPNNISYPVARSNFFNNLKN